MASMTIKEGDPHYAKLLKIWLAEGKPGWVTLKGQGQFRVLKPSNDVVIFSQNTGDFYESMSVG